MIVGYYADGNGVLKFDRLTKEKANALKAYCLIMDLTRLFLMKKTQR